MSMYIYPAIDLLDGKVVRLQKGAFDQVTEYALDPIEIACSFMASGAERLHMVDLNGACTGVGRNFAAIKRVASLGVFLEVGGGLRDEETIEQYLASGVSRCILGTIAIKDQAFVERMVKVYGEKIAVGVDARDGLVAVAGWQETTNVTGFEFCQRMCDIGVQTIIYTDITRDGMLEGANIPLYQKLNTIEGLNIIASGGVTSEDDIRRIALLGLHGVIIGKALYENKLDLTTCVRMAREAGA